MARQKPVLTPGGKLHTDLALPVEYRRQEHVAVLVAMIEEARLAESFAAMAALMKHHAELAGLNTPSTRKPRPKREPADALDALRLRLADTQELRLRASREGSYVAASNLIKMEADLSSQITATIKARQLDKGTVSDQQLVDEVASDLLAMPPVMRRAVLAIVQAGSVTRSPDAKPSN